MLRQRYCLECFIIRLVRKRSSKMKMQKLTVRK
ncbi:MULTISPECIES: zinc-finger domain-containing protein [Streptococcus]